MKKAYIIGKVTGLPRNEVITKFTKAAEWLKSMGYMAVNPVDLIPENTGWHDAMKACIKLMVDCDAVMLLPDWSESRGAYLEVMIARNLELPEFTQHLLSSRL